MSAAAFLTPLRTEKIGAHRWLLTDDLVYRSAFLSGVLIAPRGYQTDLASIPRLGWVIFPKVDVYDSASVAHDAGYGHALVTEHGDRIHLIKRLADRLFLEAMEALGVPWWQRTLMYRAVSVFGNQDAHPLAANRLQS